jgi:hypothetical protein
MTRFIRSPLTKMHCTVLCKMGLSLYWKRPFTVASYCACHDQNGWEQDWKVILSGVHWNYRGVLHATSRAIMLASQPWEWEMQQWYQGDSGIRAHSCSNVTQHYCCNSVIKQLPRFTLLQKCAVMWLELIVVRVWSNSYLGSHCCKYVLQLYWMTPQTDIPTWTSP